MKFYGTDEILILLPLAPEMLEALTEQQLATALAPLMWFIERASEGDGIKLAPSGRLGRNFVQDGDARFQFSNLARINRRAQNEDDVPALVELRAIARALGYTRTRKGHLVATAAGKRVLGVSTAAGFRELFQLACEALCPGDTFEDELVSLLLVLLIDVGPDGEDGSRLYAELGTILANRWRLSGAGETRGHSWSIAREAGDARARLRTLGLLTKSEKRFHLALTEDAGLTGAVLALQARLEAAHANPSPAESSGLVAWAIEQGYDPSSQQSIDEAMVHLNSLSYDERGRILGLE